MLIASGLCACTPLDWPASSWEHVDTAPPSVSLDSIGDSVVARQPDDLTARQQAASDFHCAVANVAVRPVEFHDIASTEFVKFFAEGCGHSDMYVQFMLEGEARGPDGKSTHGILLRRFVAVVGDDRLAALALLEREAASRMVRVITPDPTLKMIPWRQLSRVAAHDLACPRESLVLDIGKRDWRGRGPTVYLAHGCGWLGTFAANSAGDLVITARERADP